MKVLRIMLLLIGAGAGIIKPLFEDYKAFEAYKEQSYDKSIKCLQEKQIENPHDPELNYNLGVAHFRGKQYLNAIKDFERVAEHAHEKNPLRAQALYNAGNSFVKEVEKGLGPDWEKKKVEEKRIDGFLQNLERAVVRYSQVQAIKEMPHAEQNKAYAEKLIEKLKEKKKQQEQQDKNQNKDDKNKDNQQDQKDKNDKQDNNEDGKDGGQNPSDGDDKKDKQPSDGQDQSKGNDKKNQDSKKKKDKEKDLGKDDKKKDKDKDKDKDSSEKPKDKGKDKKEDKDSGEDEKDKDPGDYKKEKQPESDKQKDEGTPEEPGKDESGRAQQEEKEQGADEQPGTAAGGEQGQQQDQMYDVLKADDSMEKKAMRALLDDLDEKEAEKQKALMHYQSKTAATSREAGQKPW